MLLECPFCQSRFLVPASLFAAGPRQVQCARCRHSWRADATPEDGDQSVPQSPSVETPATVIPRLRMPRVDLSAIKNKLQIATALFRKLRGRWNSLSPKHRVMARRGATIFAIVLALSVFIFGRDGIADAWPVMDGVYRVLHLDVNHNHGGEGLAFEHMRSDLRYEGGAMKLYVEGEIHNKSKQIQDIPPLLATAMGADGGVIESWQIDPPAANLAPDETAPFSSSITAPRSTAVNINVSFSGKNNAAE